VGDACDASLLKIAKVWILQQVGVINKKPYTA
jgi:hypothetical protein